MDECPVHPPCLSLARLATMYVPRRISSHMTRATWSRSRVRLRSSTMMRVVTVSASTPGATTSFSSSPGARVGCSKVYGPPSAAAIRADFLPTEATGSVSHLAHHDHEPRDYYQRQPGLHACLSLLLLSVLLDLPEVHYPGVHDIGEARLTPREGHQAHGDGTPHSPPHTTSPLHHRDPIPLYHPRNTPARSSEPLPSLHVRNMASRVPPGSPSMLTKCAGTEVWA